jgi:hypothetical protein
MTRAALVSALLAILLASCQQAARQPSGLAGRPSSPSMPVGASAMTPGSSAEPIPFAGTGVITFGESYNADTLEIVGPSASFKATTEEIAWSAEFTGPVAAQSITIVIVKQTAAGTETDHWFERIQISDPTSDTLAGASDLAGLLHQIPGTYVLRFHRNQDLLAEGTFTLTE